MDLRHSGEGFGRSTVCARLRAGVAILRTSMPAMTTDQPALPDWQPGGGLHYQEIVRRGEARRGRFVTAHGVVETPTFMPVGTQATVKSVTPDQVADTGARVVLANTYHMGSG